MKVIVLTKSVKHGGYCVAGIDVSTGELVRLISDDTDTDGALTADDITYEDGTMMEMLDLIKVEIAGRGDNYIQPENYIIDRKYYIQKIKRVTLIEALSYHPCDNLGTIFGNCDYYVPEENAQYVGYSLALVRVQNLKIYKDYNKYGQPKTKASFVYNRVQYYWISVTDSRFFDISDEIEYQSATLVISIGTPYNSKCYKFIAAVYE